MHTFYPRQTSSKLYGLHKSSSQLLAEKIAIDGNTITSLNVNVLSNDFKRFVEKLYREIQETQDESLLRKIIKGFKVIYPEQLTKSSTTTTQTTIPYGVNHVK